VKLNHNAIVFGACAAIPGIVVLIGYFVKIPILFTLRELFLEWAVILTALAVFVGIINLISVHWQKISNEETGWIYSVILILSFIMTTFVIGFFGPSSSWSLWIFNHIQIPVETSLLAILAIILIVAIARMITERFTVFNLIFVITVLVILIGTISIPYIDFSELSVIKSWIVTVWATAGARGLLLGIALGTIATGLRILVGKDRPYSE
jgi:hypothetical protein